MLPQRMAQIRDVLVHWQLDSAKNLDVFFSSRSELEPWFQTWRGLTQFTGLRRLHVHLKLYPNAWSEFLHRFWNSGAKDMLAPVCEITAPDDFVIFVPREDFLVDLDFGDSKCVLKVDSLETYIVDYQLI